MRMVLAWLVVATSVALAGEALPPPQGKVVPEGARLEHLFTRMAEIRGGLTEGPAAAPDGSIYFSDIPEGADRGMILRFDPATKQTTVITDDSGKSNGLFFDAQGRLVACEGASYGGRRIARWDLKTGKRETLADKYEGRRFNSPNDITIDTKGRIYFSDPRYVGHETRELDFQGVFRIDPDGSLHLATREVSKPNGLAISPDGRWLYVAEHDNGTDRIDPSAPAPKLGPMRILAFPLNEQGEVAGKAKVLADFGKERGCDGMTVDVEGNIYLTLREPRRPGVLVLDPQGREIAHIPTGPANQQGNKEVVGLPSNVVFGRGAEANVLYITVDTGLYRIPLLVKGYHPLHNE